MNKAALLIFLTLSPFGSFVNAQNWTINDGYLISFDGTKASGTFGGLEGVIRFDPKNLSNSRFDVRVSVQTIATGNSAKDKHARGESWFFAEKFPEISFKSSEITKSTSGYEVRGRLNLRGVEKEISFPFTFSENGKTGELNGALSVNRHDYGIAGNFFGFVVGDDFKVTLKVPIIRSE